MSAAIVVADIGIGNIGAAVGAWRALGHPVRRGSDRADFDEARLLVVPGVGHLGSVLDALAATGLDEAMVRRRERGMATLGVCVGMQALFDGGDEAPDRVGLGLLPGWVERMSPAPRLPEMQWNRLRVAEGASGPLAVLEGAWVYFVHSYAVATTPAALAFEEFGGTWVAAAGRDALLGVQFHPERSGAKGLRFLDALWRWVQEEC
ncbi:imidazole glycerol phosphate synthase, glutamine amidotransferase subunit [Acidimicrobium ferrooxidans DSM 10331]|uniref:Imidazole glycerol phosphate synthase subunit HisH n=1 Tax=Acidimicrobium ferrooxidans (strain DSM 10331 / JCM 15462 / NBRC 103882 / ICP) TaxID=525909 RepID=C7LZ83_ACIFD|nr:imidazole glycerol phosphate synthase subunit HisH [Acidimicrobium ferrooxidans]ACU54041.1 imidazole glycerol phosphate synthase, glutamine amidotransferase subunit [Acidimicrobium ferrooxidans DSM 10331]